MFRHKLLLAVVAATAIAAGLVPAVFAGGWSIVTSPNFPEEAVAGQSFTIDFNVLQHGVTPLNGLQPLVKLTDAGGKTGEFKAFGDGAAGHYVATVTLDRAGTWQCVIVAFEGDHVMPSLKVRPAVANSVSANPPSEFVMSPMVASWAPAAITALLAVSALVIMLVSRPRWSDHSGQAE